MTVVALGRRTTRLEIDRAARKRDRDAAALEDISDAELKAKIRRRLLFVDPALAERWDAANARADAQELAQAEDPFWFRKPYFYVFGCLERDLGQSRCKANSNGDRTSGYACRSAVHESAEIA
jgi:hypothetical protein